MIMFSARCYQKAKKRYEKTKSTVAIIMTYDAIKDMFEMMSVPPLSLEPPDEKALATLPMIRLIEGRIAPAITALKDPMNSKSLLYSVKCSKNLRRLIDSGAGSAAF